ncbi:MAG: isochorismatase family protein [Planctomycetota bacterium]
MSIPRLRLTDTVLLLVDFQPRVLAPMAEGRSAVLAARTLAEACCVLGVDVIATEQVPEKFGNTVPDLSDYAGETFAKSRFSAWTPEVARAVGRRSLLVAGVEAHVCVLQTVLDARAEDRDVFLATDAITAGDMTQIAPALRRMVAAGAVETGVVSALYELMADANRAHFRDVLKLVKRLLAAG